MVKMQGFSILVAVRTVSKYYNEELLKAVKIKQLLLHSVEYVQSKPNRIALFALLLFALFIMFFGDFGIIKRIQMEIEYRQLLQEEARTQIMLRDNAVRIKNARNPDSIEKAAREKYNFRKPGETLFLIVPSSE